MTEKFKNTNWINVILFFSLALNFFIAGYMVSDDQVSKTSKPNKTIHKRPDVRIIDYFPYGEKRKFRNLMKQNRDVLSERNRHVLENQKAIFEIISKAEMDEKNLRKSFGSYQKSNGYLQESINDIVVNMLLEMDYKTRLDIIKRGHEAHERHKVIRQEWHRKGKAYEER